MSNPVLADDLRRRIDQVVKHLKPIASHEFILERQTTEKEGDRFVPKVSPLAETSVTLNWTDAYVAMPLGTKWMSSLGSFSYYGIPFEAAARLWLCIGAEHIVTHPDRGAYPVSHGYIIPFHSHATHTEVGRALDALADDLAGDSSGTMQRNATAVTCGEILRPTGIDPVLDAAMIRAASCEYSRGRLFFFRTLLLSDSMHPRQLRRVAPLSDTLDELLSNPSCYLLGIPRDRTKDRKHVHSPRQPVGHQTSAHSHAHSDLRSDLPEESRSGSAPSRSDGCIHLLAALVSVLKAAIKKPGSPE